MTYIRNNFGEPSVRSFKDLDEIGQSLFDSVTSKVQQPYESYVDIYDFFDVLVKVLKEANLYSPWSVTDSDYNQDTTLKDLGKITLVQEFPSDYAPDTELDALVIYKLGARSFNTETGIGSPRPFTQLKPKTLESSYNLEHNNLKTDYANVFTNTIEFEVFSTSLIRLQETIRLLESFVFKYKGRLLQFVDKIVYEGQSPTSYNNAYFERKMFSRSLFLRVVTYSRYSLMTEEIKQIKSN